MPTSTGIFDTELNCVLPPNTGTWADLTSWSSFTQWATAPGSFTWAIEPFDLGFVKNFNLRIISQAQGSVSYRIFTSETGEFAGEETITSIAQGATGVDSFSGQYVWIEVTVDPTSGNNVLFGVEYAVSEKANSLSLNNIDTSTLSGTSASRTITLPKPIGGITNIQITPKTVTSYDVDLYVSNTPTSNTVIPRVLSKTSTPQIALVGIDNQPRDAVVDIVIEYLPEGYMSGNNLLVR